jgi:5-methylcytosine-specific restriction protein A
MAWEHEASRHERGYGYRWVKLRQRILARDDYLCQPCLSQGRPTPATQVDHITPKSQDGADDPENLQAICAECHDAKTQREATKAKPGIAYDERGFPVWE